MPDGFGQPAQIVGREAELDTLREFVAADRSPRVLVLTGAPGIGKTTLWETGVEAARERGLRPLACRIHIECNELPPHTIHYTDASIAAMAITPS